MSRYKSLSGNIGHRLSPAEEATYRLVWFSCFSPSRIFFINKLLNESAGPKEGMWTMTP